MDIAQILQEVNQNILSSGNAALKELSERSEQAKSVSEALLMRVIRDNADTEYGKSLGFGDIHSVEEFKSKVPLSTYDDYAPYIERMVKGERNLITSYPIVRYAVTSGSVDNPKNIPVSEETMGIYERFAGHVSSTVPFNHVTQTQQRPVHGGRILIAAVAHDDTVEDGTSRGAVSSAVYGKLKPLLDYISVVPSSVFFPPPGNINMKYLRLFFGLKEEGLAAMNAPFMTALVDLMHYLEVNWEMLVRDIAAGVVNPSISMPDALRKELQTSLEPDPARAESLRREFERGFDEAIVPRIWPHLEYVGAIGGGGFQAYTEKMRRYTGSIPFYLGTYAASESLMAVATEMERAEYMLLPESGFYEFIPADEDSPTETLNLDELEVGRDYEIVLTNLSGFYRYRIGDVLRVTGYAGQTPKVCFVYRKKQMVSIAGEKTNEASIAWTVGEFEKASGHAIADYSIYADIDATPGRYVLFMEADRHVDIERHAEYRSLIEGKLSVANPSFGSKVRDGVLGAMDIRFVQQETYYLYRDLMVLRGTSENQLKPVRVIDTPGKERFFFALVDAE
ncbi:MAG: GH3 auxin-responsive promoter family protein [Bifidobacterium sp.]|uniref:GH3 auxin-responsive promoter family protein n=2 Tax=Bifidobacterium TaxID=1678 RepID=A0AB39UGL3_9BIFI